MGADDIVFLIKTSLSNHYVDFVKKRIKDVVEDSKAYLDERDTLREEAIKLSRRIIKTSGWAITEVHKGNLRGALEYLRECEEKTRMLLEMLRNYPDLLYTGLVYNSVSEYVEAKLFLEIIRGEPLPSPQDLGVPIVPYLQGLGDVVGELKRLALELVRREEYEYAWKLLSISEAIYLELRGLDYPDALLPGIRHKADVARRIVDDLKAMLIDLTNRKRLADLLEEAYSRSAGPTQ